MNAVTRRIWLRPDKIALSEGDYNLDKPFLEQYALWVIGLLQGDLGYSFEYQLPVAMWSATGCG